MTKIIATSAKDAPKKQNIFAKRYRYQILATMVVHIMTFTHGVAVGWLSPSLRILQSENTPLNEPLTIEQMSWIGSLLGLGSVAGNIFFGLLLDSIGSKWCMNLISIPNMLYWTLIYMAKSAEYLYVGRFFAGMAGGGIHVVMPIFISEITDTNIRGALSSLTLMYLVTGMVAGLIMATYLSYYLMPCIAIALPLLFLLSIIGLSDTPQFLLRKGRINEAEHAYRFYKNMPKRGGIGQLTAGNEAAQWQADQLEFETFKAQIVKGGAVQNCKLTDFLDREALKAFGIVLILILTNQLSGCFAIANYTSNIFVELGNEMDPNVCTILVGCAQILGTAFTIVLVDLFGRRVLYLTSTAGMGVFMVGVGCFKQFASAQFAQDYDWLPVVLLSLVVFIAATGVLSLMFVIVVELLPAKIRSVGTSISMAVFSFMIFISLKIYPLLLFQLGLALTMYTSAGVSLLGFLLLFFVLPETKGKSMVH